MKTQISAYFNDFNAGAKKDVIKLEIRGELTDEQIVKLHKLKGNSVVVTLASGQLELDDYEDHEDGDYPHSQFMQDKPNEEGQQLSIDDVKNEEASSEPAESESDAAGTDSKEDDSVPGEEGQQPEEGEQEAEPEKEQQQEPDKQPESEKVADITTARKRRGRPKKEDQEAKEEQPAAVDGDSADELPPLASDDDLPF
ncbi:hypothetical protein [Paenibacillus alvei]|uniref:hypothetical protein n=1 Tax=Paenibacillus alvei TaxID=44250 RepID=UPI00165720AB|nr:hypothetical protein [Paenibacillus alvei]